jgi:hypothetical protein
MVSLDPGGADVEGRFNVVLARPLIEIIPDGGAEAAPETAIES